MALDQPIHTPRLELRRFREQDAADLFDYLQSPTASCFLSLALADVEAARTEARRRSTDGEQFAMQEDDTFSVGWNLNPRFGGLGYAHEAAEALFAHLFNARAARRLYAYVEDHNVASRRLCEKLGMRAEGLFLEFISFRNDAQGQPVYENTMQYAILRKEWPRASSA
jgi:[ribosomal protein S5]-alanine N-acetyltransferase